MWWLVALAAVASGDAGALRIVEHVDPISDTKSVYAVVGNTEQHLALGCNDQRARSVRIIAHFNQYVGDATPGLLLGGTDLQYRFDKQSPMSVRWYSHGREVTAESERTKPLTFILGMKVSTAVYLRATDYDGDPVDMSFTYENAGPIIEQMLTACGLNSNGTKPKG
ncbi:MAG: hypothetical protein ACJ8FS_06390 [Sphingomicrobium sp.]